MKTLKKLQGYFCMIILSTLVFSSTEIHAQQTRQMSARDLTQESTAVLYGKCSEVKSEWNEEQDIIYTYVTIRPEGYIKGDLGSETVITIPGGRVGDIIYEVSEMPVFEKGEEVFTFIWKHPSGKNLVTGGYQGKLQIEQDRLSGKKVIKGNPFKGMRDTGKDYGAKGKIDKTDKILLDDFINEVRGYVK